MAINFLTDFTAFIKKAFQGTPFGDVYPARSLPTPSNIDGRTAALRLLKRYISELTFYRTGAMISEATATADRVYGPPIAFQIKQEQVNVETPDDNQEMSLPNVAIENGQGVTSMIGLTTWLCPETKDVYGKGTIVAWSSDYLETMTLVVSAASKAERRAIRVGLEQALTPTEQMSALRFKMENYYGQLCAFSMGNVTIDDSEVGKGRFKLQISLDLNFTVCSLTNYVNLTPITQTEVGEDIVVEIAGE